MKLRLDPYHIFENSRSPVGLYARQKWLGESNTKRWQTDFKTTTGNLYKGQSRNGSWGNSEIHTVRYLFALHLTVRELNPRIENALNWLLETRLQALPYKNTKLVPHISASDLKDLPFVPCGLDVLSKAGCLFLTSVFGLENDKRITGCYDRFNRDLVENPRAWGNRGSFSNILRAFVAHPKYSKSESVSIAVTRLETEQKTDGSWPQGIPFFLTVNTLGHLDSPSAERQLDRAFEQLKDTQSQKGSWGRTQPEWHTFLVIHALRRKNLI